VVASATREKDAQAHPQRTPRSAKPEKMEPLLPRRGSAAACPAAATIAGTTVAAARQQLPLNRAAPDFSAHCYPPHAYKTAYRAAPLLRHRINGRSQTVVSPELAEPPSSHGLIHSDISKDPAAFDTNFALPTARLRVVNTIARSTRLISRAPRK